MKASLTFEERLRAAYSHFCDGVEQQKIATLLGVNIGRVNEACKAAEHALRNIDKEQYRNLPPLKPNKPNGGHAGEDEDEL